MPTVEYKVGQKVILLESKIWRCGVVPVGTIGTVCDNSNKKWPRGAVVHWNGFETYLQKDSAALGYYVLSNWIEPVVVNRIQEILLKMGYEITL